MPVTQNHPVSSYTEREPVFDAADLLRHGKHIFYQLSNVTNRAGIEWLRRHLEGRFELVEIKSRCLDPMHIDSSPMLLTPGKALVNPKYIDVDQLPDMFKSRDIIIAPEPDPMTSPGMMTRLFSLCGKWISINLLNPDEKRTVIEESQSGAYSLWQSRRAWGNWGCIRFMESFTWRADPFTQTGPKIYESTRAVNERSSRKSDTPT